jgi:anthranilate phosphoribosyltransferase
VLGVYHESLVEQLARVLSRLGCRRGFVVYGMDGMDEITLTGPTRVAEIRDGQIKIFTIEPEDFGLSRCPMSELQGGNAVGNAEIVRGVLRGETGPRRDVVLLNAAFALVAAGAAEDIPAGLKMARESIDQGRALAKLEALVVMTNE